MQEQIAIDAIQAATMNVFSTMLGKVLECQAPRQEQERAEAVEGVIAQISVVGACSITTLVCCSAEMACSIASVLLMQQLTAVDGEVLDAMAEIANMILGSAKTDLDAYLGEVNLGIPTVTYGTGFLIHSHSKRGTLVPFLLDGLALTVKVCFEPPFQARRPLSGRASIA